MNIIEVTGGVAKEREIVENVVYWCIKKLMPRVRTLDIEVNLANCSSHGYCMSTDDKTFELEIKKGLSIYDLIVAVCHEMIHVRQYYRKEINHAAYRDTKYMDLPWEKEAYNLEETLAIECFKNLQVNLTKNG